MITLKKAKELARKAENTTKGIISAYESDEWYFFTFGDKDELPPPGQSPVAVNKKDGHVEFLGSAPIGELWDILFDDSKEIKL